MGKPEVRTPASWSCSMKPGDLVKYKGNGKCYLVSEVRKIKGEVRYFHLDTFHPQRVFYSDDVKVINETR